ncbi:conserved hypothetical protein [Neospora caninum Liverpool]|uniref:Uncharacterized protein n=1 Tax=Neospora caninum (strain Liverpool) TaxID=572307 RepID=F0VAB0_NEOCL|nr:conserved hypothetical protein [Neospora caninum Liverpool]CBZ50599.1 conserved hypothetical protein [Neospora caninum Liverpool]CEL65212.1 TPA: hypothetical protein BN1204_010680 [Neospora caninum Liverpool]|eukprot:XP_003880632.1 conserved hypothetical protein [Neospora caninum Liverpool]
MTEVRQTGMPSSPLSSPSPHTNAHREGRSLKGEGTQGRSVQGERSFSCSSSPRSATSAPSSFSSPSSLCAAPGSVRREDGRETPPSVSPRSPPVGLSVDASRSPSSSRGPASRERRRQGGERKDGARKKADKLKRRNSDSFSTETGEQQRLTPVPVASFFSPSVEPASFSPFPLKERGGEERGRQSRSPASAAAPFPRAQVAAETNPFSPPGAGDFSVPLKSGKTPSSAECSCSEVPSSWSSCSSPPQSSSTPLPVCSSSASSPYYLKAPVYIRPNTRVSLSQSPSPTPTPSSSSSISSPGFAVNNSVVVIPRSDCPLLSSSPPRLPLRPREHTAPKRGNTNPPAHSLSYCASSLPSSSSSSSSSSSLSLYSPQKEPGNGAAASAALVSPSSNSVPSASLGSASLQCDEAGLCGLRGRGLTGVSTSLSFEQRKLQSRREQKRLRCRSKGDETEPETNEKERGKWEDEAVGSAFPGKGKQREDPNRPGQTEELNHFYLEAEVVHDLERPDETPGARAGPRGFSPLQAGDRGVLREWKRSEEEQGKRQRGKDGMRWFKERSERRKGSTSELYGFMYVIYVHKLKRRNRSNRLQREVGTTRESRRAHSKGVEDACHISSSLLTEKGLLSAAVTNCLLPPNPARLPRASSSSLSSQTARDGDASALRFSCFLVVPGRFCAAEGLGGTAKEKTRTSKEGSLTVVPSDISLSLQILDEETHLPRLRGLLSLSGTEASESFRKHRVLLSPALPAGCLDTAQREDAEATVLVASQKRWIQSHLSGFHLTQQPLHFALRRGDLQARYLVQVREAVPSKAHRPTQRDASSGSQSNAEVSPAAFSSFSPIPSGGFPSSAGASSSSLRSSAAPASPSLHFVSLYEKQRVGARGRSRSTLNDGERQKPSSSPRPAASSCPSSQPKLPEGSSPFQPSGASPASGSPPLLSPSVSPASASQGRRVTRQEPRERTGKRGPPQEEAAGRAEDGNEEDDEEEKKAGDPWKDGKEGETGSTNGGRDGKSHAALFLEVHGSRQSLRDEIASRQAQIVSLKEKLQRLKPYAAAGGCVLARRRRASQASDAERRQTKTDEDAADPAAANGQRGEGENFFWRDGEARPNQLSPGRCLSLGSSPLTGTGERLREEGETGNTDAQGKGAKSDDEEREERKTHGVSSPAHASSLFVCEEPLEGAATLTVFDADKSVPRAEEGATRLVFHRSRGSAGALDECQTPFSCVDDQSREAGRFETESPQGSSEKATTGVQGVACHARQKSQVAEKSAAFPDRSRPCVASLSTLPSFSLSPRSSADARGSPFPSQDEPKKGAAEVFFASSSLSATATASCSLAFAAKQERPQAPRPVSPHASAGLSEAPQLVGATRVVRGTARDRLAVEAERVRIEGREVCMQPLSKRDGPSDPADAGERESRPGGEHETNAARDRVGDEGAEGSGDAGDGEDGRWMLNGERSERTGSGKERDDREEKQNGWQGQAEGTRQEGASGTTAAIAETRASPSAARPTNPEEDAGHHKAASPEQRRFRGRGLAECQALCVEKSAATDSRSRSPPDVSEPAPLSPSAASIDHPQSTPEGQARSPRTHLGGAPRTFGGEASVAEERAEENKDNHDDGQKDTAAEEGEELEAAHRSREGVGEGDGGGDGTRGAAEARGGEEETERSDERGEANGRRGARRPEDDERQPASDRALSRLAGQRRGPKQENKKNEGDGERWRDAEAGERTADPITQDKNAQVASGFAPQNPHQGRAARRAEAPASDRLAWRDCALPKKLDMCLSSRAFLQAQRNMKTLASLKRLPLLRHLLFCLHGTDPDSLLHDDLRTILAFPSSAPAPGAPPSRGVSSVSASQAPARGLGASGAAQKGEQTRLVLSSSCPENEVETGCRHSPFISPSQTGAEASPRLPSPMHASGRLEETEETPDARSGSPPDSNVDARDDALLLCLREALQCAERLCQARTGPSKTREDALLLLKRRDHLKRLSSSASPERLSGAVAAPGAASSSPPSCSSPLGSASFCPSFACGGASSALLPSSSSASPLYSDPHAADLPRSRQTPQDVGTTSPNSSSSCAPSAPRTSLSSPQANAPSERQEGDTEGTRDAGAADMEQHMMRRVARLKQKLSKLALALNQEADAGETKPDGGGADASSLSSVSPACGPQESPLPVPLPVYCSSPSAASCSSVSSLSACAFGQPCAASVGSSSSSLPRFFPPCRYPLSAWAPSPSPRRASPPLGTSPGFRSSSPLLPQSAFWAPPFPLLDTAVSLPVSLEAGWHQGGEAANSRPGARPALQENEEREDPTPPRATYPAVGVGLCAGSEDSRGSSRRWRQQTETRRTCGGGRDDAALLCEECREQMDRSREDRNATRGQSPDFEVAREAAKPRRRAPKEPSAPVPCLSLLERPPEPKLPRRGSFGGRGASDGNGQVPECERETRSLPLCLTVAGTDDGRGATPRTEEECMRSFAECGGQQGERALEARPARERSIPAGEGEEGRGEAEMRAESGKRREDAESKAVGGDGPDGGSGNPAEDTRPSNAAKTRGWRQEAVEERHLETEEYRAIWALSPGEGKGLGGAQLEARPRETGRLPCSATALQERRERLEEQEKKLLSLQAKIEAWRLGGSGDDDSYLRSVLLDQLELLRQQRGAGETGDGEEVAEAERRNSGREPGQEDAREEEPGKGAGREGSQNIDGPIRMEGRNRREASGERDGNRRKENPREGDAHGGREGADVDEARHRGDGEETHVEAEAKTGLKTESIRATGNEEMCVETDFWKDSTTGPLSLASHALNSAPFPCASRLPPSSGDSASSFLPFDPLDLVVSADAPTASLFSLASGRRGKDGEERSLLRPEETRDWEGVRGSLRATHRHTRVSRGGPQGSEEFPPSCLAASLAEKGEAFDTTPQSVSPLPLLRSLQMPVFLGKKEQQTQELE